jgi:[protein-PII] uridylyltransferase
LSDLEPTASPELKARMRADWERFTRADRSAATGTELARRATTLVEDTVRAALEEAGSAEGWSREAAWAALAPVALGSFGRRDMTPYSDVDLMFVVDAPPDEGPLRRVIDRALYSLWDMGFTVGHAVRTIDDALRIGGEDPKVLSSLLDARPLLLPETPEATRGDALIEAVDRLLAQEHVAAAYIAAKQAETAARRRRFGETVYLLQPNVKEGQGGLRDLQTAWWIARARWRVRPDELLLLGILSPAEERDMERAYDFLLRVRAEMHLLEGRRTDNLRFDLQERLGQSSSPARTPGEREAATERFMRAYYFHAGQSVRIAQLLVERATSHPRKLSARSRPAPGGFKVWNDTLTVAHRDQFASDPAALIRIFRIAQDEAMEIYSYTKNIIRESRRLMNGAFRRRADVVDEFLAVIEDPKGDGSIVAEMHEMGVLRGMIPEFARVTARWQHSLYHVYTVDVHSIRVLRNLKDLRRGVLADAQPELTRWIAGLERPAVLYLAGLLHDVGKGWPRGDHSERGERVARSVGERFEAAGLVEWTSEETEDLAWLVREHLTMSDLSQRRDVADPDLVAEFARTCGSLDRLQMLYILTFADMSGTSPKVWTSWKASLLQQLYRGAAQVLTSKPAPTSEDRIRVRRLRIADEIEAEAKERTDLNVERRDIEVFTRLAPPRYLLGFSVRRMVRHVEMWRDVSRFGGIAVHTSHLSREGTTRLTVVCPDRPGLLALLSGTLSANGLQILSAQGFSITAAPDPRNAPVDATSPSPETERVPIPASASEVHQMVGPSPARTEERLVVDVLYVTDEQGQLCEDPRRWRCFRTDLESVIFGGADVDALFERRRPAPTIAPRPRPDVGVEVRFSNDESPTETVVDVFGPDGLGALYRITAALGAANLEITLAKISTQGDRVADGFYVVDANTKAKITSPERQDEIRSAIRRAFASIGERPRALSQIV